MTKKFWNGMFTVLSILQSCSRAPSKAVENAFTNRYPEAKGIVWQKGPQDIWSAAFYFEKFYYKTAYYNAFGEFKALEDEIYDTEIPEKHIAKISVLYPNSTIFHAFKLETGQILEYIFEIEHQGKLFGIQFCEDGLLSIIPPNDYRFTSQIQVKND